jgi:hypothetical protein
MTVDIPERGHTLVIARSNGQFEVRKMNAAGGWDHVRSDFKDLRVAWEIARAKVDGGGCKVWYRLETEPDSAIRLYDATTN